MKKLLLAASLFATLTVAANHDESELSLRMIDNSMITASLDQNCMNYQQPQQNFHFEGLSAGNHFLKVIRWYYVGHCHVPKQKLVYNGWISVPPSSKVHSVVDMWGNYNVQCIEPVFVQPVFNGCCPYHQSHAGQCSNPMPYNPYQVMSPQDFYQLKYSISCKSFDNTKLTIAKQALMGNYLTSAQVSELASLMTFENTKLELAKFAYARTIDKQNYYIVNNVFTFESTIDELTDYIYHHG
jgi:hypothetical protein